MCIRDRLQRRPDVRQAEQNLKAAMASAGMAYADRFPRLTISLTGGLENDALKDVYKRQAVLPVGGLWWWLRPEPVQPILPVVQVEPAETDDIELYGEYVGRIRARQFVEIRARVEGFLEKMLFEEGTYVKKVRSFTS